VSNEAATYEYDHRYGNENVRKGTWERPYLMQQTISRHVPQG